jgi:hypothetical protein
VELTKKLQPLRAVVVELVKDAAIFRNAVTARRARRAGPRTFGKTEHILVINVVLWLLDISEPLGSPDLTIVTTHCVYWADDKAAHITRSNVIFAGSILAQVCGEEGIELQLTLLQRETPRLVDEIKEFTRV